MTIDLHPGSGSFYSFDGYLLITVPKIYYRIETHEKIYCTAVHFNTVSLIKKVVILS